MKLKAATLFVAICLVCALASSPAYARSKTAFGSFHIQSATVLTEDQYLCLTEDNGAVVNNCTSAVDLFFDLPIDSVNAKTITIQDYWNGPPTFTPFNCVSYVYKGKSSSSTVGTQVTFTAPLTTLSTKDTVSVAGETLSVICYAVPPGEGVASLRWNQ